MVGKLNLHEAGDPDRQGSARATPGLGALDQEREASMADEGGASGAAMESEDEAVASGALTGRRPPRRRAAAFLAGAAAGVVLAWALRRSTE